MYLTRVSRISLLINCKGFIDSRSYVTGWIRASRLRRTANQSLYSTDRYATIHCSYIAIVVDNIGSRKRNIAGSRIQRPKIIISRIIGKDNTACRLKNKCAAH